MYFRSLPIIKLNNVCLNIICRVGKANATSLSTSPDALPTMLTKYQVRLIQHILKKAVEICFVKLIRFKQKNQFQSSKILSSGKRSIDANFDFQ